MRRHFGRWGAAGLAAVVGSALMAAPSAETAAAPTPAPRDGRIVVANRQTGQIETLNPDGTAVQAVSPPDQLSIQPAWSPHSSRIAYAHLSPGSDDFRIAEVHADGTEARQVVGERTGASDFAPTYTPDGTRILYSRCRPDPPGGCALWSVRVDGTHRHGLTPYAHRDDFAPEVSPGGRRVAFTRFDFRGIQSQIWVMRLDGTHAHPVTRARLEAGASIWTPDGRHLLVTSRIRHLGENVYRIRDDGSHVTQLTHRRFPHSAFLATPSPSGRWIVFSDDRAYPGILGADLVLMGRRGGHRHATTHDGYLLDADWGTAPLLPESAVSTHQKPRTADARPLSPQQLDRLPEVVARQLGPR